MKLKIALSRWISRRMESDARRQRRALRDHRRLESGRIRDLEIRSRGLRLYAAWSSPSTSASKVVDTVASDWHPALQFGT